MPRKQRQHIIRKVSHDTDSTGLDASLESLINQFDEHSSQLLPSRMGSGDTNTTLSEINETPAATSQQQEREASSTNRQRGITDWIQNERDGILWIIGCAALGAFIGFSVGCGWFTAGYGSYQHVVHESGKDGLSPTLVREYVVSAWRVALAGKIRSSFLYKLAMSNLVAENVRSSDVNGPWVFNWISTTRIWPPNYMLSFNPKVDLQKLDPGENTLAPMTASFLSLVLPWRRPLIKKLSKDNLSPAAPPSQMPSTPNQNDQIDPYYHPMAFSTLREYVIRFKRGYVHPDLGFLAPAPSGAARGIGMIRDSFNNCQINCFPGTNEETMAGSKEYNEEMEVLKELKELYPDLDLSEDVPERTSSIPTPKTTTLQEIQDALNQQATATEHPYTQQVLMMRIPLEAQITRTTAFEIINPLIPDHFRAETPLDQLDDAFLLALLLVHESGLRSRSRFWPYIATLPPHPSCAMHRAWRQSIVDVLSALALEMGTDVHGWPNEISKASDAMDKIAGALTQYGSFIEFNNAMFKSHHEALRWALCQVASRAIAGNETHGRLRLVPMMDMINHDEAADMFIELKGDESAADGHFIGAVQEDAGAFVVRSQRHDRRKVLKKGQELMANYNVPHYSPLDWFINMGYVPPEREGRFTMLDSGLPRDRRSKYKTPASGVKQQPQPNIVT